MIYGERRIKLAQPSFGDYRRFVLESLWPQLLADGHQPLCLLNGLIGLGTEDVLLIVGFESYEHWLTAQPAIAGDGAGTAPRSWIEIGRAHV